MQNNNDSNDYQQEYEDDEEPVELYEVNLLDIEDEGRS